MSAPLLRSYLKQISDHPSTALCSGGILHAVLAAFDSLRESGKLPIFLSDPDLETVLRFRDAELATFYAVKTVEDDSSVVLDENYQFFAPMGR